MLCRYLVDTIGPPQNIAEGEEEDLVIVRNSEKLEIRDNICSYSFYIPQLQGPLKIDRPDNIHNNNSSSTNFITDITFPLFHSLSTPSPALYICTCLGEVETALLEGYSEVKYLFAIIYTSYLIEVKHTSRLEIIGSNQKRCSASRLQHITTRLSYTYIVLLQSSFHNKFNYDYILVKVQK